MAGDLSIEETNKMRLALGMKPLPVANSGSSSNLNFKSPTPAANAGSDADNEPGSTVESRQAAAGSNWQKLQEEQNEKKAKEARRQQLKKQRDAAQRYAKLEGKGLGEGDEDEQDTRSWLLSSNKRQKKIAKERTKQLEKELAERENQAQYTEKDLAGKRVGHELSAFDDGDEQVLTLKDAAVDDEDEDDELENVNLRDDEKLKQRLELKKKKPIYDPNAIDEDGEKTLLGQYDDDSEKKKKNRFTLNDKGSTAINQVSGEEVNGSNRTVYSLDFLPEEKPPVSDYQDVSEIKIKKPKKKKDKTKKRRAMVDDDNDDVLPTTEPNDQAVDAMEIEDLSNAGIKRAREEASLIDDDDLQANLASQRRSALKKRKKMGPEELAQLFRDEDSATPMDTVEENVEDGLVIDATSEFVATLEKPKIPKERQRSTSIQPVKPASASPDVDEEGDIGMPQTYNEVESPEDQDARVKREMSSASATEDRTATGLDEEGTLTNGLGGTLSMLKGRGLVKTADQGDLNATFRERQRFLADKQKREVQAEARARAQRERDRQSGKFDRMSAKEREQYAQDVNKHRDQAESRWAAEQFNREYKPNVELKYIDEFGRSMNQREAFKNLSHQFHGKGSGKQKREKLLAKIENEKKKEAMSALDSSQSTGMNTAMKSQSSKNRQAGVRLQ